MAAGCAGWAASLCAACEVLQPFLVPLAPSAPLPLRSRVLLWWGAKSVLAFSFARRACLSSSQHVWKTPRPRALCCRGFLPLTGKFL